MKIAVIKLGARIVFGDNIGTSGGSGEARSIINMLLESGNEVHVFTKINNNDFIPENVVMHQIDTDINKINDCDVLLVINGVVNFFGGVEDPYQILNYWIINNFKNNVFYIYCDPNLQLRQLWDSIKNREWGKNWDKEDIEITRSISVISQSTNLPLVKSKFKNIKVDKCIQYDFQKFPLMFSDPQINKNKNYTCDLIYGGTFRSGRREDDLIKFYFGYPEDFNVEVFGKITLSNFNESKVNGLTSPIFTKAINYNDMINKMSTSKSHIVIGDKHYPKMGMLSQRIYESIMAGCITFIDSKFDPNKKVYKGDKFLCNTLYVSDKKDVYSIVKGLSDSDIFEIATLQLNAVNVDIQEYCDNFTSLLK